ncbi:DUF6879 family protein [Nocardia flavorosea]|uniref:DUF6879 domain-containing protein n=1 Tax=Nocardia flavorosea TaxID=53429 RepID=A0A846YKV7_9NOCA|nr:DUF6879 family protein [Nocardia flavorosea]NKY57828.1 hypothetical protein [Nocardia flavorosea]
MELRSDDDWFELLEGARRSAFHLEVRDCYAEPEESEPLRRYLNGELEPETDRYDKSDWIELVETLTARGVLMRRVRVITEPLSGYHHWLLTVAGSSVDAGEDIRYAPRHLVEDVPADDWWLFDDDRVGFNLVDDAGKPAGAAVTADPGIVAYCRATRDRLWRLATPFTDYVAAVNARQ